MDNYEEKDKNIIEKMQRYRQHKNIKDQRNSYNI